MDMEPGIINVKQEVPGVGTMNQKVGFVSMLLSATGMGLVGTFG
ncbi:EamA family transporter, partial [Clostridioides difficile]|nr:EamA family transporter [Clostridioides difficile]